MFELYAPAAATRYHAADQALFDTPGVQTYEANVPAARVVTMAETANFHSKRTAM